MPLLATLHWHLLSDLEGKLLLAPLLPDARIWLSISTFDIAVDIAAPLARDGKEVHKD